MSKRAIVLPWFIWFLSIIFIIGAVVSLSSCAHVPYCEHPDVLLVKRGGEVLGIMYDEENAEKLMAMVVGLSAGTCRLPPQDAPL